MFPRGLDVAFHKEFINVRKKVGVFEQLNSEKVVFFFEANLQVAGRRTIARRDQLCLLKGVMILGGLALASYLLSLTFHKKDANGYFLASSKVHSTYTRLTGSKQPLFEI